LNVFFVVLQGTNSMLPKNGDEWDRIRDGKLPKIKHCSDGFNDLLLVRNANLLIRSMNMFFSHSNRE